MDALDGLKDLEAQPEARGEGEGPAGLSPSKLRQVPPLELHDDVVEPVVPAATDEPANVLLPYF